MTRWNIWYVTYGTYDEPDVPPILRATGLGFREAQARVEAWGFGYCMKPENPHAD